VSTINSTKSQTVLLLTSGATYGSIYWDFDLNPDRYSFVRAAVQQGYSTFNYDRLGIGQSTRPIPELLSVQTEADLVHYFIGKLRERNGAFGDGFSKVVTIGHSLGSVITQAESSLYNDADGQILTGYSHTPGAIGFGLVGTDLLPAALVDSAHFAGVPLGYLTTASKAVRQAVFYSYPGFEQIVVNHDDETKQTVTLTETGTFPPSGVQTILTTIPTFVLTGDNDILFCGLQPPCSFPLIGVKSTEKIFYPGVTDFTIMIVPNLGHCLQLHYSAPSISSTMLDWVNTHI